MIERERESERERARERESERERERERERQTQRHRDTDTDTHTDTHTHTHTRTQTQRAYLTYLPTIKITSWQTKNILVWAIIRKKNIKQKTTKLTNRPNVPNFYRAMFLVAPRETDSNKTHSLDTHTRTNIAAPEGRSFHCAEYNLFMFISA